MSLLETFSNIGKAISGKTPNVQREKAEKEAAAKKEPLAEVGAGVAPPAPVAKPKSRLRDRNIRSWGTTARRQLMEDPLRQKVGVEKQILKDDVAVAKERSLDDEIRILSQGLQERQRYGLGQLDFSGLAHMADGLTGGNSFDAYIKEEKLKTEQQKAMNKPILDRIKALNKQREKVSKTNPYTKELLKSEYGRINSSLGRQEQEMKEARKNIYGDWHKIVSNAEDSKAKAETLLETINKDFHNHSATALASMFVKMTGEVGNLATKDIERVKIPDLETSAKQAFIQYLMGDAVTPPKLTVDNYANIIKVGIGTHRRNLENQHKKLVDRINSSLVNRASVDDDFYQQQKQNLEHQIKEFKRLEEYADATRRAALQSHKAQGEVKSERRIDIENLKRGLEG